MSNFESEKELLKGLANQNRECIEKIYKVNYPAIQSMVVNNSGNADDAADIFQETMIVLFEKANNPEFELNCQLKTFIYSVARRLWLKKIQKQQRFHYSSDDETLVIPVEEDLEEHENRQHQFNIMENALTRIGEPCKSLLEAFYIHKKHMQEIADEFKYTNADNAKTQKYKCLMRLKKLFFAEYKKID